MLPESWFDANTFSKSLFNRILHSCEQYLSERSFLRFKFRSDLFSVWFPCVSQWGQVPRYLTGSLCSGGQSASHGVDLGPHPKACTKGSAVLLWTGVSRRYLAIYSLSLKGTVCYKAPNSENMSVKPHNNYSSRKQQRDCRTDILLSPAEANNSDYYSK
jgi:hypothetical protein